MLSPCLPGGGGEGLGGEDKVTAVCLEFQRIERKGNSRTGSEKMSKKEDNTAKVEQRQRGGS